MAHPLRSEMARQKTAEATPRRATTPPLSPGMRWLGCLMALGLSAVSLVGAYKVTHQGHLPRSTDDMIVWLTPRR